MTNSLDASTGDADGVWPVRDLELWCAATLREAGLRAEAAQIAAERLLLADLIGVRTHGLARLPSYWKQLKQGGINARPLPTFSWGGDILMIDADLGLGHVVAPEVFRRARAALGPTRSMVAFVIRNAGHFGALGTHLVDMAEAGLIAFLSQVTQPVMSPAGATQPAIGNNPIAFAAPRPDGSPLLFDFAASRVARGKIHVAARDGRAIPSDWAIGPDGQPTDDADTALAGSILPTGDHKGIALAMMVEVLAGALAGARPTMSAGGAPSGVGAFGFVLDPGPVGGAAAFAEGMSLWVSQYLRAAGPNGRIPGQRAAELRRIALRDGLTVPAKLLRQLEELAFEAGAPLPRRASS